METQLHSKKFPQKNDQSKRPSLHIRRMTWPSLQFEQKKSICAGALRNAKRHSRFTRCPCKHTLFLVNSYVRLHHSPNLQTWSLQLVIMERCGKNDLRGLLKLVNLNSIDYKLKEKSTFCVTAKVVTLLRGKCEYLTPKSGER